MKKIMTVLAISLLVAFLAGCGANSNNDTNNHQSNNKPGENTKNDSKSEKPDKKDDQTETEALQIGDYYPIKENTRYVYEGSGNEYASFSTYVDYVSGDKFQQRVDNGGTVTVNVMELTDGKLTKVYSKGEAYYRENLLKSKGPNDEILLMEPLKKGTTWTLNDSRVRTITNTSAKISTPTGDYQAIEVTTESDNGKTLDYYAKNVGLVKSIFLSNEAEGEVSSTLSKIEENVPLIQRIAFYYPNIDDEKYYYKTKEVAFSTNDVTRNVLAGAYKKNVPASNVGNVLSDQAKINSLYMNADGHVYIDLNEAFVSNMNAGSMAEQMILQSIVNTIGQYYQADKVYLTIDNHPYESGHFSMKKGEYLTVNVQDAIEIK